MKRHPLLARVHEYVALRRRQGYQLKTEETVLLAFARFASDVGHEGPLTVDLAVRWAESTLADDPARPSRRLGILRPFARHLATTESATEVPPLGLLRPSPSRAHVRLPVPQTPLLARIAEYVELRRRLGYRVSTQETLLVSFARFAEQTGHQGPITVDLAVRWAQTSRSTDPAHPTRRLQSVRGFAKHLAALEPDTEVPPAGMLGHPTRRRPPHVYSDAEIAALLHATVSMRPHGGLRSRTYAALFSLLVSTGLRLGEACRLRCRDADLERGVLTIRESKFHKSRLVPLHPSALPPLRRYALCRDGWLHAPRSEFFFRTDHAPCLTVKTVDAAFSRLRRRLGWTEDGRARRPRIHDVRHTFVVRRLVRWYADGVDVDRKMLHLAAYLGHVDVSCTYWYLTAVPELMALAADRFEHAARRDEERAS